MDLAQLSTHLKRHLRPGVPKYLALKDAFIEAIASGTLQSGDKVPNEQELAATLPMSLGTIQRALRMDSELDFASAAALETVASDAWTATPQVRHLALIAQPINRIDITGVEAFMRLEKLVAKRDGMLHIVGMKLPMEQRLKRAGLLGGNPRLLLYRTDAEFLDAIAAHKQRLEASEQARQG